MIKIFAISGSLRNGSSNSAILKAASRLVPPGVEMVIYQDLDKLPHFNPDLEDAKIPHVIEFRNKLKSSNGILIASPEYAHGFPGVIKNALDWIVGSGELVGKPVMLLNASPRAVHAQESLKEVMRAMEARILPEAPVDIHLPNNQFRAQDIISHAEISRTLQRAILTLIRSIEGTA